MGAVLHACFSVYEQETIRIKPGCTLNEKFIDMHRDNALVEWNEPLPLSRMSTTKTGTSGKCRMRLAHKHVLVTQILVQRTKIFVAQRTPQSSNPQGVDHCGEHRHAGHN